MVTSPKKRRAPRKRRRTRRRRHRLAGFAKWTVLAAVWGLVGLLGVVTYFAYGLPDIDAALDATRRPGITIAADDGSVIATRGDLYGRPVRIEELPPHLIDALLAIEDRRFYSHFGLDVWGIARAALRNVMAGGYVQGGSTLTQQVAKNLFLTPERTLSRKIRELLLALWLEGKFSKDQILEIYLNRVYLGAGAYGVEAAAGKYFGKRASRLTLFESAIIAGLPKAPSRYNPHADPEAARRRARQVLHSMVAAGVLSEEHRRRAVAAGAEVTSPGESEIGARHFVDWVNARIRDYVGSAPGDLIVLTTLDAALQRRAERSLSRLIARSKKASRVSQAALVALAGDGAIKAMVGGVRGGGLFNHATLARRQPGSAFKPFVFLAGLESGLTETSLVEDAPIRIGDWSPTNIDGRYRGPITVKQALAHSVNTVAVRVAKKAGPARVKRVAARLGIGAPMPDDLGLALGTAEVTLLELTSAFVPFANGGYGVFPHAITEIRDRRGRVFYRRKGGGAGRVVRQDHLQTMNRMLRDVVRLGTGKNAALEGPVAGKTGTSQGFRDAWFIGYTRQLIGGVWMGNSDGTPMKGVTGGGLPARLWKQVMAGKTAPTASLKLPARPSVKPKVTVSESGFLARMRAWISGE